MTLAGVNNQWLAIQAITTIAQTLSNICIVRNQNESIYCIQYYNGYCKELKEKVW